MEKTYNHIDIYKLIFESSTEGILVCNKEGEIVMVNNSLTSLFRYNEEELVGEKMEILLPKEIKDKHIHHRESFNNSPERKKMGQGRDLSGVDKEGNKIPVEISLNHMTLGGELYVMALVTDISERKASEDRIHNLNAELEQKVIDRTNKLKQSLSREMELNELKTKFVSMVSHEFRTPLSTILSSVSLIEKYEQLGEVEKKSKHLSKVKRNIHNLTAMLNDTLTVSRMDENSLSVNFIKFDLKDLVSNILVELEGLKKKGQEILVNFSGELEIETDPKMLKVILSNLMSNALKYSGLDVKADFRIDKNKLSVSIEDKGIGIPKSEQEQIFGRFFRAGNVSNVQGTGLGLNIVNGYILILEGKIKIESEENKGTSVNLEIPLR